MRPLHLLALVLVLLPALPVRGADEPLTQDRLEVRVGEQVVPADIVLAPCFGESGNSLDVDLHAGHTYLLATGAMGTDRVVSWSLVTSDGTSVYNVHNENGSISLPPGNGPLYQLTVTNDSAWSVRIVELHATNGGSLGGPGTPGIFSITAWAVLSVTPPADATVHEEVQEGNLATCWSDYSQVMHLETGGPVKDDLTGRVLPDCSNAGSLVGWPNPFGDYTQCGNGCIDAHNQFNNALLWMQCYPCVVPFCGFAIQPDQLIRSPSGRTVGLAYRDVGFDAPVTEPDLACDVHYQGNRTRIVPDALQIVLTRSGDCRILVDLRQHEGADAWQPTLTPILWMPNDGSSSENVRLFTYPVNRDSTSGDVGEYELYAVNADTSTWIRGESLALYAAPSTWTSTPTLAPLSVDERAVLAGQTMTDADGLLGASYERGAVKIDFSQSLDQAVAIFALLLVLVFVGLLLRSM